MSKSEKQKWKPPVILYEEPEYPGAPANPIPYIETSINDPMPPLILIEEMFDTGEMEMGTKGVPEKVCDYKIHQYLDLQTVQKKLTPKEFDDLRQKLGMMPQKEAAAKGSEIFKKIEQNLGVISQKAQEGQEERMKKAKEHFDSKTAVKNEEEN